MSAIPDFSKVPFAVASAKPDARQISRMDDAGGN